MKIFSHHTAAPAPETHYEILCSTVDTALLLAGVITAGEYFGDEVKQLAELIDDGESGLLAPPGNVEALVNAIRRTLDDESLRQRLARQGRRKVLAEFDIDEIGGRIAGILRERLSVGTAS